MHLRHSGDEKCDVEFVGNNATPATLLRGQVVVAGPPSIPCLHDLNPLFKTGTVDKMGNCFLSLFTLLHVKRNLIERRRRKNILK